MPNPDDPSKTQREPAGAPAEAPREPLRETINKRTTNNKKEIGGADGPEPTRYGDWERNGRCTDF